MFYQKKKNRLSVHQYYNLNSKIDFQKFNAATLFKRTMNLCAMQKL